MYMASISSEIVLHGGEKIVFRAGDIIQVKEPAEIAATLDENGTLDGLPFMPEMAHYCGRRFRVLRRAEKTCLEMPGGAYQIREFWCNDAVLLEGLRCSGESHGACQRMCMFFWKTAWLKKPSDDVLTRINSTTGVTAIPFKLKSMSGPDRYFCQSTELHKATNPSKLSPWRILHKCYRDLRGGTYSLVELASLVAVPLCRKIRDKLLGRPRLRGPLARTPVANLVLRPGEWVEVKSLEEIQRTLDANGKNRGLPFDIELQKFCGRKYRVLSRLDQMISEATGKMRKVEATVILDGNQCMCARALGGCPRLEYCYWREIWLKRVDVPATKRSN